MKIISRRSFSKFIGMTLGSVPLPGVLKTVLEPIVPEAEKLEDLEEIFQGLVKRFRTIPLTEKDGLVIGSFLRLFKEVETVDESRAWYAKLYSLRDEFGPNSPEVESYRKTGNQVIRFWREIVDKNHQSPLRDRNISATKNGIIPEVIRVTQPYVEELKKQYQK